MSQRIKRQIHFVIIHAIPILASMSNFKIISYNVNGIRSALNKGLADWIKASDYDIILFQELKADLSVIPTETFEELGYHCTWFPAQKKGYSGVGAIFKEQPDQIIHGMNIPEYDNEGRMIQLDFGDFTIINSYFPSGSSGDIRQEVKMKYLEDFYHFIQNLKTSRPNILVSGDYNICHRAIDIHDPVGNKNSSGFLPEERAWMDKYFDHGFIDTFRHFNQEPNHYSWWSYRARARSNNKGWRIDYHAVTESVEPFLLSANILSEVVHSDHCPILVEIDQKIA
ncbi:MAG: exodeoxyribonuclease III [Chitinophagales bacterium]|nr:exodeoxyribonuclease III [Chitinophagales bacterium]